MNALYRRSRARIDRLIPLSHTTTTHYHNIVNYFSFTTSASARATCLFFLSWVRADSPEPAFFWRERAHSEFSTTSRVKRSRTRAMSTYISQKNALLFTAVTGFGYGLQFMPELPSASTDRANASEN